MDRSWEFHSVGTDSELFLYDRAKQTFVPVIGRLGGTKDKPLPVPALGEGFAVQEDNVMAEFNVPPTGSATTWLTNLTKMLSHLKTHFEAQGLELRAVPSAIFPFRDLVHPQARTIGCDPDYNAWTMEENEIDRLHPLLRKMRTGGGHIHIGFTVNKRAPEIEEVVALVRLFDYMVTFPMAMIDLDTQRRQLYGNLGAFRLKPYGVECRTLSNAWLQRPDLAKWVFKQTLSLAYVLNERFHTLTQLTKYLDQYSGRLNDSVVNRHPMAQQKLLENITHNVFNFSLPMTADLSGELAGWGI